MKVVAYTRVSTKGQAEDGLGLEVQEQAIRAWAKANRHTITAWTTDEGISGAKDLAERDGLADALRAVRMGQVSAVVVYRLDRLARDLVLQEQLLAEIWRTGGDVLSTAGGETNLRDDPDDPSRQLIRQVLGAVASYERKMIALRLRSGRRRKADNGGYAYGSPALGYEAVDHKLVEEADGQATLCRIKELRAAGASLREICAVLEQEGHRTKRGGTTWHSATVGRIVERLESSAA